MCVYIQLTWKQVHSANSDLGLLWHVAIFFPIYFARNLKVPNQNNNFKTIDANLIPKKCVRNVKKWKEVKLKWQWKKANLWLFKVQGNVRSI